MAHVRHRLFNSTSHKYNRFQMLLDVLLSYTTKTFHKVQWFKHQTDVCLTVYMDLSSVQSFHLIPAGFNHLPSLYPSLLLVSSLYSTPPASHPAMLRSPYALQSFMWMGVGVTEEWGNWPPWDHTHTHTCMMSVKCMARLGGERKDYRGNVVSVVKIHKQTSKRFFC